MDPHLWLKRKGRISPYEVVFWPIVLILPFWLFPTYLSLSSQIAITALFCISLDLILGYAGIISLGHAAFFGIGAYAAGLLSAHGWGEPLSGLAFAAVVAAFAGWIVSFMIVRVQHLALLMITWSNLPIRWAHLPVAPTGCRALIPGSFWVSGNSPSGARRPMPILWRCCSFYSSYAAALCVHLSD